MGRFPLSDISRWRGDRVAIEVRPISDPLFPGNVVTVASLKPKRFVLDGEIVVPSGRAFSFDDLLQRIHPAASRVKRLAGETPALLIVFDLLIGDDGQSLVKTPLASRRKLLEAFARKYLPGRKPSGCRRRQQRLRLPKNGSSKWEKISTASSPNAGTCPTSPAIALACKK
jgi:ATP-dependent DNA ligase